MDVNVHATRMKPTESRLIGFADFVGIARWFTIGRVMGDEDVWACGELIMAVTDENGLLDARG
jgi:hypothetical protein